MSYQEIYRDWIRSHRKTEPSPEFAETVMRQIDRIEADRLASANRLSRFLEKVGESSWAQAAAVAVAAAIGLGRIVLTLHLLFFA